jgi:tRNA (guanine37-N1)-methyltransferase
MFQIDVLTLFADIFPAYLGHSIIGRAIEQNIVNINVHDIRRFAHDRHNTVDDYPYGGGAGMVMKPEPIFEAVEHVSNITGIAGTPIILLTPQGKLYNQDIAYRLSKEKSIMLICGHYEGIDERVAQHLPVEEISVGDYVLSGGESAAMVIIDSLVRLLPGVLGSSDSLSEESHNDGLLEYPQFTRPPVFRGWAVPEVLLSGNHQEISKWRHNQSILRTATRRPDLLNRANLSELDRRILETLCLS